MRIAITLLVSGCLATTQTGDPPAAVGIGVSFDCYASAAGMEWVFDLCAAPGVDAASRVMTACEIELGVACEATCIERVGPRPCLITTEQKFPPD